jgi:hypothetical protein
MEQVEYTVVYSSDIEYFTRAVEDFSALVTDVLKDGWVPQGGVAITRTDRGESIIAQAFVRTRKEA